MSWVRLAAVLFPLPELGTAPGLVVEAANGAEGAGVVPSRRGGGGSGDWLQELDEELLDRGPLVPSKLARPGPVRALSPPSPPRPAGRMSCIS